MIAYTVRVQINLQLQKVSSVPCGRRSQWRKWKFGVSEVKIFADQKFHFETEWVLGTIKIGLVLLYIINVAHFQPSW